MPLVDDIVAGAAEDSKQQLQEVLLELLKQNPDILESVTKSSQNDGQPKINGCVPENQKADEEVRRSKRSQPFPECQNDLNKSPRDDYHWNLSDNDGIDSAWSTATRNMTPRELSRWRKSLFSVYVGHLPCDITKRELVQLFSEVGNVQDVHINPGTAGAFTFGFVRFSTLEECKDALVELHGRTIGNRALSVEYASETRQRLENGDDADDRPIDKEDKLLRREYPKVSYRPMSETDSQEKTLLWKLRTSATKLTSQTGVAKAGVSMSDGQGISKEETFMGKIQEIVKKVVGLSVDTHSSPSLSESSAFSSWIEDRNNTSLSRESDTARHEQNMPLNYSDQMINGMQPEANSHSPFEKMSVANHTFQEGEPLSPIVPSLVKEPLVKLAAQVNNWDMLATPNSQVNGKGNMSEGDLCPSSPACDTSSFSDTEAAASDSFSLESASPEQPVNKHYQFCNTPDTAQPGVPPSSAESSPRQPITEYHKDEGKFCEDILYESVEQHTGRTQYKKKECSPHIHLVDEMDRHDWGFRKTGLCSSNSVDLTVKNLPSCEGGSSKSASCIPTESSSVASISITTGNWSEQNIPKRGKETLEHQSHIVNTGNLNLNQNTVVSESYEHSERENTIGQRDPLPSGMSMNEKQRINQGSTMGIDKNTRVQPAPEIESVIQRQEVNLGHVKDHTHHTIEQDNPVPPSGEVETSPTMHMAGTVGRGMPNSKPPTQSIVPPYLQSPKLTNIIGTGRNQPRVRWPLFDPLRFLNPQLVDQMLLSQAGQLNANLFLQQQLMASGIPYRLPFQMGGHSAWPRFGPRFPHPAVHMQGQKNWHRPHRGPNIEQTQTLSRQIHNGDHQQPHFPGITPVQDVPNPPTAPVSVKFTPINNTHRASQDSTISFESDKSSKELSTPTSPCEESSPVVKAAFITPSFPVKTKNDPENPGSRKVPPSKLNPSEIHFMELKDELEKVLKENEKLRRCVCWKRSEREHGIYPKGKQASLESLIHSKEVQLQKEKEIIMARNTEQELLYEREKLEAAFDQQLMKELETEWQIADTKNRIVLARMEGELLPLYQQLYRTRTEAD